jgi:hypothetical protein
MDASGCAVEYGFRPGASFQKGAHANPQIIGEHLAYLREQNEGKLHPSALIDDAKNPNSPLHRLFEWDDSAAAQQYRLQQARSIIRSVVVRYRPNPDSGAKSVRAFVAVRQESGERHYTSIAAAMSDEDIRKQTIRRAWDELQRFKAKYQGIAEFASLFASLEEIESALPPVQAA